MLPTPHISVRDKGLLSENAIICGDPIRAKNIAYENLKDVKLVSKVRNMFIFTGNYKNTKITIMSHGMGMGSAAIYINELFKFYNVKKIIRVGSCGSYNKKIKLNDIVVVKKSYCESNFIKIATGEKHKESFPSLNLNEKLIEAARLLKINLIKTKAHCSDVFYRKNFEEYKKIKENFYCNVVEMESSALFSIARMYKREASCLLYVTDSLVTRESLSSDNREKCFKKMSSIALEAIVNN